MISGGPKDTITSLWTKGLKALVPPNSFGPPTMVGVVVDFKDRVRPSPCFIQIVEKFFQDYRVTIKKHDKGERLPWRVEREAKSEWQIWSEFSHYYKEWLMRTNPDLTTDPMAQYESKKGEVKSGVVEAVQRRHSGRGIKGLRTNDSHNLP